MAVAEACWLERTRAAVKDLLRRIAIIWPLVCTGCCPQWKNAAATAAAVSTD
jgi:hypothetical protein